MQIIYLLKRLEGDIKRQEFFSLGLNNSIACLSSISSDSELSSIVI
jgi:hypothetical protein